MALHTNQEMLEGVRTSIDGLSGKMDRLLDLLAQQNAAQPQSNSKEPEISLDYDDEVTKELKEDMAFHKRRGRALIVSTLAFAALSLAMYYWVLPLFGITFGFFLSLVITDFVVLFFDPYILPGDSIKRISKNGVGAAIVWLSFAIMLFSGVQVGNSLITNRGSGEENYQPAPPATGVSIPAQQPAGQYNATTTTKEN